MKKASPASGSLLRMCFAYGNTAAYFMLASIRTKHTRNVQINKKKKWKKNFDQDKEKNKKRKNVEGKNTRNL